jgi:hypothetical protein
MGKKNKKKTIASTRPVPEEVKEEIREEKKPKKLLKIFSRKDKKTAEEKAAKAAEQKAAKEEKAAEDRAIAKEEKAIAEAIAKKAQSAAEARQEGREQKPKKRILAAHKQKIKGGILALIGLFALTFIGWFLFGKMFRPQYLAEILPADKTVAVLEINIDGANGQPKQFYELMAKYPVYQKEGLVKLLTLILPVDYTKDVEPWLGRRVGMGLLTGAKPGQLERVYFIESRDHEMTLAFMKGQSLKEANEEMIATEYKGYKIYSYTISHLIEFTFINNYLVIAENGPMLKTLLDGLAAQEIRLADSEDYRKAANNLPQGALMQGYADMQKFMALLAGDQTFMAKKGQDFMAFKPFLSIFRNAGMTVFADKDKFVVQTFTGLNKDALKEGQYLTYGEKYKGSLLSLAGGEPVILAGGHDLSKEINRIAEIFSGGTKTSALVFEGLLEAQKEIYFGKEVSLKNDIYPLLTGEYLFTVDNSLEKPQFTLVIELPETGKDIPRLEKVMSAFEKTSGIFTPRIQEVTLPDGTKGQEIVASPEKVERYQEKYNETSVTTLKLGETGWSVFYATDGGKVVLTTNKDLLKNILDRAQEKMPAGFSGTNLFRKIVQPALSSADEISIVRVGALTQATGLNEDEMLKPYLLPFATLTTAKNYFSDGISTIYLLEII